MIALLLLCNCLNLVSVLGFSAPSAKSESVSPDDVSFEEWQKSLIGEYLELDQIDSEQVDL